MANLVMSMTHGKRKGDTIHIPAPVRGAAHAKSEGANVILNKNTAGTVTVLIDKHYEYSLLLEDITELQQLASHRQFITKDAGYALAKQVDTDLIRLGRVLNGATLATNDYATSSTSTKAFIGSNGTTAYNSATSNAATITEAAIRRGNQYLDDADVPQMNRNLIIPPVAKNAILAITRFTEYNMLGEVGRANSIRNGEVGDLFGVKVFVTTNADYGAGNSGADRICLLFQEDCFLLATQQRVRTQTQYKQESLATLFTADTVYGVKALRADALVSGTLPSAGVAFAVPG